MVQNVSMHGNKPGLGGGIRKYRRGLECLSPFFHAGNQTSTQSPTWNVLVVTFLASYIRTIVLTACELRNSCAASFLAEDKVDNQFLLVALYMC